jgi:hypothetical protein
MSETACEEGFVNGVDKVSLVPRAISTCQSPLSLSMAFVSWRSKISAPCPITELLFNGPGGRTGVSQFSQGFDLNRDHIPILHKDFWVRTGSASDLDLNLRLRQ